MNAWREREKQMKVDGLVEDSELKKSKKEVSKELLSLVGINPIMRGHHLTKKELIAIKERIKEIKQENEYYKEMVE